MTALTYGEYLQIEKLLSCQSPRTDEHDEVQFIVVHQVFELWFKLVLHEIEAALDALGRGAVGPGARSIRRITEIARIFPHYIGVLETMRPQDFHRFRTVLEGASGLQSEQFREIEVLSGMAEEPSYVEFLRSSGHMTARIERRLGERNLRAAVQSLLDRERITLDAIYAEPERHAGIHDLLEASLDYDEVFLTWRFAHVRLA